MNENEPNGSVKNKDLRRENRPTANENRPRATQNKDLRQSERAVQM
jgi:hypothetical protein